MKAPFLLIALVDITPPVATNTQPTSVKVAIDQLFIGTYSFR
ncbi:hypothetical protein [Runella limosa]|nr:hypothetical protein [Runella limosa]